MSEAGGDGVRIPYIKDGGPIDMSGSAFRPLGNEVGGDEAPKLSYVELERVAQRLLHEKIEYLHERSKLLKKIKKLEMKLGRRR
jgi:hypothetical protein